MIPRESIWGEAQVSALTIFWPHASAAEIAGMLGPQFTRNAVIGKAWRLGILAISEAERLRRAERAERKIQKCPSQRPTGCQERQSRCRW
jgi:hypothetical protein